MSTPRVSVVVPTYQRAQYLAEVIPALLSQTLENIEVIVCDDGSTDGTSEVVSRFRDSRRIYLRNQHLGMPGNLNAGFQVARAPYVMTCHDHDVYEPTLLAELAAALDSYPSASYAHSGLVLVDPAGTRVLARHVENYAALTPGLQFLRERLLPGIDSAVSALTMIRVSALSGRVFDPHYGFVADVEMWLRLATTGDVAYVPKALIRVRQRDETSELHPISHRLVLQVLRAKRAYLHLLTDEQARKQVERGWRRQATSTVLRELLHAQQDDRVDALTDIRSLADETNSFIARVTVGALERIPRTLSVQALRSLRYATRLWRSAVTVH